MATRFFTIGDIHGCARELDRLLAALPLAAGDTVAFVGDYVDRGFESQAVIDLLLEFERRPGLTTVFLKGNHEDMCLAYLGREGSWGEAWCLNGGAATLRSYGIDARLRGEDVAARLPPSHLAFLERLQTAYFADGHLIVHAGVRPDVAWEDQDEQDLLWIREEFILRPHTLPQTVVFGHTPQRNVYVDLPYKIGIDTGCVYGGMLTALELHERRLWQVRLGDARVREGELPPTGSARVVARG
jgi:diadenosine tetraphosphatase ApaH/serine/threonine PP2A family protein phosphatase